MGPDLNAAHGHGPDEDRARPRPSEGGWTADDLDRLPNLPPHTELLDGSLVLAGPRTNFHARAVRLLDHALLHQVPDELDVIREMTVRLDERNRPEPDVLVFRADADTGPKQTWYRPEDVVIVVEVVSEDSEERNREVKPRKYAKAGIPHSWRAEENRGLPVVHVHALDPATRTYGPTGIFHDKLEPAVPFPVEIDLTAVDRRRRQTPRPCQQ